MFTLQSQNLWLRRPKSLIEKMEEGGKFSFRKELYAFLNNTVCHCYRHLAQVDRSYVERQGIILFIEGFSIFVLCSDSCGELFI